MCYHSTQTSNTYSMPGTCTSVFRLVAHSSLFELIVAFTVHVHVISLFNRMQVQGRGLTYNSWLSNQPLFVHGLRDRFLLIVMYFHRCAM